MGELKDVLVEGGFGVIATASAKGEVNLAIYAVPEVLDDGRVVFGMTEGLTYRNLAENPSAAYMYVSPDGKYKGVRLKLTLTEVRDSGKLLEKKRERLAGIIGSENAKKLKYLAYFEVKEVRPLV